MADPRTLWFVINLDRAPDHLDAISRNLDEVGVPFTRIPAVDGTTFDTLPPEVDPAAFRRAHGRDVQNGDVGCYLSHIEVMRAFLDTSAAYAMVLEDDAIVTPEAVRLVEGLTAPGAPDDWDMVKFEAHHKGVGLTIRHLGGDARLCALPTRPTGAAAYLVNRTGASAMRDRLLPMVVPYDHAFDRGWVLGTRVRTILPLPIDTRIHASTVTSRTTSARKVKLWRKGPTLLWRVGTEVMRVVSALHAWVAPTKPFPWPRRPARDA